MEFGLRISHEEISALQKRKIVFAPSLRLRFAGSYGKHDPVGLHRAAHYWRIDGLSKSWQQDLADQFGDLRGTAGALCGGRAVLGLWPSRAHAPAIDRVRDPLRENEEVYALRAYDCSDDRCVDSTVCGEQGRVAAPQKS